MARRRAPRPVAGVYPIDQGELELLQDADVDSRWLLRVNGVPQSFVDLEDPQHLEFDYVSQLAAVLRVTLAQGTGAHVVHLGGGGATLARQLAAADPTARQLVFERDGALVEVVRSQLGFPSAPAVRVRVGDARTLLWALREGLADAAVSDVFTGGSAPPHVTTVEYYAEVRRVLAPTGRLLVNVADGRGLTFARSQVSTLAAVFSHVMVLGPPGVLASRRFGNLIIVAGNEPLAAELVRDALSREQLPVRVLDPSATVRFAAGGAVVTDATAVASPTIPR